MNRWIATTAGLGAALLAGAGGTWFAGSRLPERHTATLAESFEASPEEAWRAVTDLEHLAEWRRDVASVELTRTADGRPGWIETDGWGEATAYEVVEARFPDHFVAKIADESLPYGGTWTWRFESAGTGCHVTITEDGFVRPAAMRALARYAIGHDATMRQALDDLEMRLEQPP